MQDAIAHYHELLTDELAQASEAMLSDQLRNADSDGTYTNGIRKSKDQS